MLDRKRIIMVKTEVDYGVDAVPSGSANAILCRNLSLKPLNSETVGRDLIRPYLGASEQLAGMVDLDVELEIEMQGSGTPGTAPAWAPLLLAAGFAETVTAGASVAYEPISGNFPSVTIYVNYDGVLHKSTGARGDVEFKLDAKAIPVLSFKFKGLFVPVVDDPLPIPDYSQFKTPRLVNTTNTPAFDIHGFTGVLQSLSLKANNKIVHRSLVNSDSIMLTDREANGSFLVEAVPIATIDFFQIARDATLGPLSITHGIDPGLIITLSAPNVQIVNPDYDEADGITMLKADIQLIPGSTGNDELKIELT